MSLASDLDNSNRNINEEFPIVIDNRPQYQQPPDPEGGWARRDSVQVPFLETGTSCSDIFLAAMAVEMAAGDRPKAVASFRTASYHLKCDTPRPSRGDHVGMGKQ